MILLPDYELIETMICLRQSLRTPGERHVVDVLAKHIDDHHGAGFVDAYDVAWRKAEGLERD